MPLYDFKCHQCGEVFERRVTFQHDAPVCPKCSSHDTEKVFSVSNQAFVLKGQGFYKPSK
jgi:putative FmdB family regulatory protein